MTTTGVVGGRWRASISEWGAIEPWDGSSVIDWFVAADDRWHTPQHEATTRQIRVDGTPVVETRVRIPGGDAVHRVYSIADGGGMTVIEVTNESTLPIAVAFTGGGLLTRRAPTSMPPQGIDLPADAVIHPIGHSATLTVARLHGSISSSAQVLSQSLPTADQVARGWLAQTQRASRLQLPDSLLVEAVTAARCELLLNGPLDLGDGVDAVDDGVDDGVDPLEVVDPATLILGIAELVRLGDAPAIWVPEIATQLELWARRGTQIADAVSRSAVGEGAVEAAARVLHAAGEHRAVDDLRRMRLPTGPADLARPATEPGELPSTPGLVPSWVERQLVISDEHAARLMPSSFPAAWLGIDFEAHGLAIGLASTLSFAIRWHGDRPAVLWEVDGAPMPLSHGSWTTGQLSGEALWDPVTTPPTTPIPPTAHTTQAPSPSPSVRPAPIPPTTPTPTTPAPSAPRTPTTPVPPTPFEPPPDESFS